MTDTFNCTAAYNKPSYTAGEPVTVTISGNNTHSEVTTGQIGPLTIPLVAAGGATSTISVPQVPATTSSTTIEAVTIDPTRPVVDTSPTPRTWTISANKLSITAVA
jgi:hypothetical protein